MVPRLQGEYYTPFHLCATLSDKHNDLMSFASVCIILQKTSKETGHILRSQLPLGFLSVVLHSYRVLWLQSIPITRHASFQQQVRLHPARIPPINFISHPTREFAVSFRSAGHISLNMLLNRSSFCKVLLWLLSYLCWSWNDLPTYCQRICSPGRHPLMGNNVASHSQEKGYLVLCRSCW